MESVALNSRLTGKLGVAIGAVVTVRVLSVQMNISSGFIFFLAVMNVELLFTVTTLPVGVL